MSLLLAIIGHLVGDYLLQNDWMALNKKRNLAICAVHATIWTLSVALFSGWFFYQNWRGAVIGLVLYFTHLIQDHTNIVTWWMSLIGQKRFMKCDEFDLTDMRVVPGLGPWSIIVVDNVWHIVTLWAVWKFIA